MHGLSPGVAAYGAEQGSAGGTTVSTVPHPSSRPRPAEGQAAARQAQVRLEG